MLLSDFVLVNRDSIFTLFFTNLIKPLILLKYNTDFDILSLSSFAMFYFIRVNKVFPMA